MKLRRILAILLLLSLIRLPVFAAEETENVRSADQFVLTGEESGYIVQTDEEITVTDDVEQLAEGIYLTHTLELAEEIAGEDGIIEPDCSAELMSYSYTPAAATLSMMDIELLRSMGHNGAGVRIAIIDSGIDRNSPGIDASKIEPGYDYITETENCVKERFQHGSNVTACVQLVAPEATIVPLCCFGYDARNSTSDLIRAIGDAVNKYHCDVIQMSWGMRSYSSSMAKVVRDAWEAGAVLVASAGNDGNATPNYPALYSEVIGVGSVGKNGAVSDFSTRNAGVTLTALGEGPMIKTSGSYTTAPSGTSFSAPLVSGAVALILEYWPEISNADAKDILIGACDDAGDPGYDYSYGYGILNPEKLFPYVTVSAYALTYVGKLEAGQTLAAFTAEGKFCGIYSGEPGYCTVRFNRAKQLYIYYLGEDHAPVKATERFY